MFYRLTVPQADPNVEEIRVLEWHGEPGAKFEVGDMIVELETHKAVVEVRAGQPGYLREITTPEGEWQKIGQALCLISDAADEPAPAEGEAPDLAVDFEVV
jgi:pyruvate/2-oxoglutarate dehydrogenase complex dihydrolipoamide acyltransferase (E2) component